MNSEPASPGSRGLRSALRRRVPGEGLGPRVVPPDASLLQPQLNAVEKTPQPELELLRGGPRRQFVGQLDDMRVLLGWQRPVKLAQRQALRCAEPSGAEIVHRLLQ